MRFPPPKKIIRKFINILPTPLQKVLRAGSYIYAIRSYYEYDFEVLKYIINPGDYVVDIGANAGGYTKILSKLVGDKGVVYAIEPIPETFKLLSTVITMLRLKNVKLFNYGISDISGMATMEVPFYCNEAPLYEYESKDFYQARIICKNKKENSDNNSRQYSVVLKTLDALFYQYRNKIKFIKCDVEGHELSVIKGAEKIINKYKPSWLIEISGNMYDKDSNAGYLYESLVGFGYVPYLFDGKILKRYTGVEKSVNYFFIHPIHKDSVDIILG